MARTAQIQFLRPVSNECSSVSQGPSWSWEWAGDGPEVSPGARQGVSDKSNTLSTALCAVGDANNTGTDQRAASCQCKTQR